jgi:hypothetical protein
MSDQQQQQVDLVELRLEASTLRGRIREAGDAGDVAEVRRLVRRIHDLELDLFADEYTDVRHARRLQGRPGGYNPQLEQVEHKLSERLARLGQPPHAQPWRG